MSKATTAVESFDTKFTKLFKSELTPIIDQIGHIQAEMKEIRQLVDRSNTPQSAASGSGTSISSTEAADSIRGQFSTETIAQFNRKVAALDDLKLRSLCQRLSPTLLRAIDGVLDGNDPLVISSFIESLKVKRVARVKGSSQSGRDSDERTGLRKLLKEVGYTVFDGRYIIE